MNSTLLGNIIEFDDAEKVSLAELEQIINSYGYKISDYASNDQLDSLRAAAFLKLDMTNLINPNNNQYILNYVIGAIAYGDRDAELYRLDYIQPYMQLGWFPDIKKCLDRNNLVKLEEYLSLFKNPNLSDEVKTSILAFIDHNLDYSEFLTGKFTGKEIREKYSEIARTNKLVNWYLGSGLE